MAQWLEMSNSEETVNPKIVTAMVIAAFALTPVLLIVKLIVPQRKPK